MNRYIKFDSEKFLKESKGWENEIANLQKTMDELAGLQRKGEPAGKSQSISDNTAAAVIDRQKLQQQIERIEAYQLAYDYAWRCLPEVFRDVLTVFFFTPGVMHQNVRKCSQRLAICINEVYKLRREALAEVADLVEEWYKT